MAIYGIGAYYNSDVSADFIKNNVVGVGWSNKEAPELHEYIKSLKVGDIIYIKSVSPSSPDIIIKAVGIICDNNIVSTNPVVSLGRNVKFVSTTEFRVSKPHEKNNVRSNTLYEEFHPEVQKLILEKFK